jgi:enamine deaminase RidA (YjgF/YER057c/UK114 family)
MGRIETRMAELGLVLPPQGTPRGRFAPFRRHGDTVWLSGQVNETGGRITLEGPVGAGAATLEAAREAAKLCALNLLVGLKLACDGDLDRVAAVMRLGGFVNCVPGWPWGPKVIDGATEVFIDLWGDDGVHARTAIGVASLPGNAAVEVDAIVVLRA